MVPATATMRFIDSFPPSAFPFARFALHVRPVIRLDQISKQHGKQILFLEASMSAFKGEKVGLVGPNGSGKATIFRMIVKEEQPDAGTVAIDRGITVGYFSQDVGEMKGRRVVAETMAGGGGVSTG